MDCGPTCLKMIAEHYGKKYPITYLRERTYIDREGVSLKGISEAAERIGFRSLAVKLPITAEKGKPSLEMAPMPCIVHHNQKHFVVVYKVTKTHVFLADPGHGKFKVTHEEFAKPYISAADTGIALILEPTPQFHQTDEEKELPTRGLSFLLGYMRPHRKLIVQVIIGLFLGTIFQLILPFLTQSLVDVGIDTQNLNFIYLVLAGQLMIFFSQTIVQFLQSWILLHISVRMNVSLISDFLFKLMQLPLGFFDSKHTGDLLQRIQDHHRIEKFLTGSILSALLSVMNILVFGIVLLIYSVPIFLIFAISSILYWLWIFIFLKKRKEIDYAAFSQLSDNNDSLIEIIQGMPEIKLQGSQLKRRWKWAEIQAKLFRTQIKSLSLAQYQDAGAFSINQLKDILITFVAAKSVLDGQMTLGMMLAIQYIIGQLNGPLRQLIAFIRSAQDASISLERLSEVHQSENEESTEDQKIAEVPSGDIEIDNVTFRYTPITKDVLTNVSFTIPRGKTTAIVGGSGSGKTTLIKLLLGFYEPTDGKIAIGHVNLSNIQQKTWRENCGVVMQEGYIFSDSIAANIAESDHKVNYQKIQKAIHTANIADFIQLLPLGLRTMVGAKGNGLSQGQKQRLFIARAVYKNPEILFFDEATNALDANNEKIIMQNLDRFLVGKTSVVVAHRLSTVKNADQIIVIHNGQIVEQGQHEKLVQDRGYYYKLVQNQLELGN